MKAEVLLLNEENSRVLREKWHFVSEPTGYGTTMTPDQEYLASLGRTLAVLPRPKKTQPADRVPSLEDAKGSLTNEEWREIAKDKCPPQAWFDAEEEQLF